MKYGFMLIELIIATLIASMIGTLLLTALSQATRFQQIIDTLVDTSLRVGVVNNQLEKDFMGAFIPMQARLKEEKEEEPEEESETKKEPEKKEEKPTKEAAQKTEPKEEKKSKPAEKPLEKIFYGTTKEGHLDILTFITNNPLTVFVGKEVGVVKPKIVRVQYMLKPENEKEKTGPYILTRQESIELDLAKYTNVRAYEVIGGIKECTITYIARIKKEQEKPKQAAATSPKGKPEKTEQPKIQYEYKTLQEWTSEPKENVAPTAKQAQQKSGAQEEEKNFPRIPYMIEIKMTLWNIQRNKTEDFVFMYQLPIDLSVEQKEEPEKKVESKETKEKSGPPEKDKQEREKAAHNDSQSKEENLIISMMKPLENIMKIYNKM